MSERERVLADVIFASIGAGLILGMLAMGTLMHLTGLVPPPSNTLLGNLFFYGIFSAIVLHLVYAAWKTGMR